MNYNKALVICMFVELGESTSKLYDELMTQNKLLDLGFNERTFEENKKFIRDWKRRLNIRLTDYVFLPKDSKGNHLFDSNNLPIIVKKRKNVN